MLEANYLAPVFVAVDSLDLRAWQFIADKKPTLITVDNALNEDADNVEDGTNDLEYNNEGDPLLDRFDLHGIIQQFYPWLDWMGSMVSSFSSSNKLVLLDARFSDHVFPKISNQELYMAQRP
ncbi:MAG: hypothetical protein IPN33_22720 [Saprospiraceae bacterium]|nr:hypothetical protein [Saprospiraceae bacterium]